MKLWIAKNEQQTCCVLYRHKLIKTYDSFTGYWVWKPPVHWEFPILLDETWFQEVTFDNSPQEVEIKLKEN